ncbi:hypothetical protein SBOR_7159 [Sclerotinia borealis F-4128]|uniref:Uncharacterized protein n=1 Tax=Sclerotinia borealis (strain F-4128) TaxID=1432307 RepID=W9C6Q7_SCLBF|nr:hypothetical protein SBOR_7159 [Sclerotinia borealis F-4128]
MRSTVVLTVAPEYRGEPRIPSDAKTCIVVVNTLDGGWSYKFTVLFSKTPTHPRANPPGLIRAFANRSLDAYTNYVEVGNEGIFIANSLCVALQRFMLGESHHICNARLPVQIAIRFGDGPLVSLDTSFVVEEEVAKFLRPGPPPNDLHRFIDLATYCVAIDIPAPRRERVEEKTALMEIATNAQCANISPIDEEAYRATCPDSPLFDSYPNVSSCSEERCDAITRVLLSGKSIHGVSKALVIGSDGSAAIFSALRKQAIEVSFSRRRETYTYNDYENDQEWFAYSPAGKYTFDKEKYDLVFIDMPSSEDLALDARQKCELATSLRDAGAIDGLIILSSATDNDAVLRLRNTPSGKLDVDDPFRCVLLGTFDILANGANTLGRFILPDHPIYSSFHPTLPNQSGVFICNQNEWSSVLSGRSYLLASSQMNSIHHHVRLAESPLQCYAALKVGAPSLLPTSLEKIFDSETWNIHFLPSSFFSHNPRFFDMVAARYDELSDICCNRGFDAPKEIFSSFSSRTTTVLLKDFSRSRFALHDDDLDEEDYLYEDISDYNRVLPFETMAILCSISFFCILRMYLHAYDKILDRHMNAWDLQDLLWRLTAFGSWEEKRYYMCSESFALDFRDFDNAERD